MDDSRPIFVQIAERIAADILEGTLAEEAQVPSTNELAAFYRINPATVAKGVSALVADGVLYKKRGIGMFVTTGARGRLLDRRREAFVAEYVAPLVREATRLGIGAADLRRLLAGPLDGQQSDGPLDGRQSDGPLLDGPLLDGPLIDERSRS
ncbi:GntR family transcriptional regulator [Pengzhenrongella sicca]|uniref:GntR family transcriptional regulator n=1 Tax=Pengzhenrongella sicca TaxID=2819238 RepID=A0A8A4ZGT6_9MICO|nr:GntR family transcriptional regulator [Pengzhenrongella sicca]QTE31260.1 GntR family transcriptional regulator [Pengzhenrongella sicca]